VERPFTATQACNQFRASQEPLGNIVEESPEEDLAIPENSPTPLSEPNQPRNLDALTGLSNLDLRTLLLALAQQSNPRQQRKHRGTHEPDTFSGGTPDNLRAFIFQYQIYFRACEGDFKENSEKIYFAISYLRGIALDCFEPYINEPDPTQSLDFLEDWLAFVQKLSNIFGSYSPEDDDEDAIVAISFPNDEKAVNYFIHFAKYQNRIRWDDRSLQKVVKDVLPPRISDELRFSREDLSTFEGLKRAVMRIDSDYWRRVQDGKNKSRQLRSLQDHNSKLPRTEPNRSLTPERTNVVERPARERAKYSLPEISPP